MNETVKKDIPMLLMSFCIGIILFEYFFDVPIITVFTTGLKETTMTIATWAMGLGVLNILVNNSNKILKKEKGWYMNLYMILFFVLILSIGLYLGTTSDLYVKLLQYGSSTAGYAIFSLLGIMFPVGIYWGFKLDSIEGVILIVTSLIAMFANAPIGQLLLPANLVLRSWIQNVPNMAGIRGFIIVMGLGVVYMTIRVFFGKESTSLGG